MSAALSIRCERCACSIERGDLRCSLCGLATPAQSTDAGNALSVTWVRCTHCGAGVEYDAKVEAARCAFCASEVAVEKIENPPEQVQEFLPFAISDGQAETALRGWLSRRGFFAPGDLSREATIHSLRKLFWAAWVIDADGEVSWTVDANVDTQRAAWAPFAGQYDTTFRNVLVSASQGLTEEESLLLGPHYDLRSAQPYVGEHHGAAVESFETDRAAARSLVVRVLENMAMEDVAHSRLPGTRHRHLHVAVKLKGLHTRRLALPAFVLAYRYHGELFRVILHGQKPSAVFGSAPRSPWKIAGVVLAAAAALAAAGYLVLLNLP